ncbi:MAG: DNA mismatch repair protein MutS, partial [Candidatus Binatia bacterium]
MKLTPMLAQYLRMKADHPDALLFFRLGDFYEMFFDDAERAAPVLEVALTSRSKKDEVPVPMCGVPYHAVQSYIAKLLAAGLKVAICDQMEDPVHARGLVERAVVRVVTPGTVTEEECLDPKSPNYLVAVCREATEWTLAAVDLSTGEFLVVPRVDDAALPDELVRLAPREVLLPAGETAVAGRIGTTLPAALLNMVPEERFAPAPAQEWLAARGAPAGGPAAAGLAAVAALLCYLRQTHGGGLEHLRLPEVHGSADHLQLDQTTRCNLELLATTRGDRRGSLLWVVDQTLTPMGGRLLRRWLLTPLTDIGAIGERLDAVERLYERPSWRHAVEAELRHIGDLERLTGRLAAARVTPRDLAGLAASLERVSRVQAAVADSSLAVFRRCAADLDAMPDIGAHIAATLRDDPPLNAHAGGLIRTGFDPNVDELRRLSQRGKRGITELEASERARTGITSLKVRYNQVFGYYIEVTKPNLHLVPSDYRRKQTIANAERFVTASLEAYEAKVTGAEESLRRLEYDLFAQLVQEIAAEQTRLSRTAAALARLDVFCALAATAERRQYTRPQLSRSRRVVIRAGRHPVVEVTAGRSGFVPNDCLLDPDGPQILTITGPNMAGKSTYIRQVALAVLMAQI